MKITETKLRKIIKEEILKEFTSFPTKVQSEIIENLEVDDSSEDSPDFIGYSKQSIDGAANYLEDTGYGSDIDPDEFWSGYLSTSLPSAPSGWYVIQTSPSYGEPYVIAGPNQSREEAHSVVAQSVTKDLY